MKNALLILFSLLSVFSVHGQVSPKLYREIRSRSEATTQETPRDSSARLGILSTTTSRYNPYEIKTKTGLISPEAFARLIKRDITFIVLGSQSPTPGFSLDLSNELSVKITGQAPTKKGILTIDFGASRTSSEVPIFAEGKFNGKLNIGINFHYIPKGVLTISKKPDLTFGSYTYTAASEKLVTEITSRENDRLRATLLDSVAVLAAYVTINFPAGLSAIYNDIKIKPVIDMAIPGPNRLEEISAVGIASAGSRQSLFLKLASNYVTLPEAYTDINELVSYLKTAQNWQIEKLLTDLQRLARSYNNVQEIQIDREIARSQPYWLRKQLQWFTFSAKPVLYTVNTYENDTTRKVISAGSMNFVEFELPIWYQLYDIGVKGGNLLRFGVNLVLGSNREIYRKVKYSTNNNIASYPPYVLAEQKQEEGIYVNGTNRDHQLYANYYIEYYRLPKKNFIPGYSLRFAFQKSAAFGEGTERKTRLEAGLVFNILNKEKDQSAFTLQPYAGLTNLDEETLIENGISRSKRLAEKLVVGIRLGLPIRGQLNVSQ